MHSMDKELALMSQLLSSSNFALPIACVVLLLLWGVVYRLFFHPVAKYPGPFLNKISIIPCIWYAIKGNRHLILAELHEQYGDVVRYGPNFLSFNMPKAIRDIYGASSGFCKAKYYSHGPPGHKYTTNIVTAVSKAEHGRKRRLMSGAMSDSALRKYEQFVCEKISLFLREIMDPKSFNGQVKNMSNWFDFLAYDIMGHLAFGKGFNMMESDEHHYVQPLLEQFQHRGSVIGTAPWLEKYGIARFLLGDMMSKQIKFRRYAATQAAERITRESQGEGIDDIFRLLMQAKDKVTGEKMGMEEIAGEAAVLITAGSDTSSTALSGLTHYLAADPARFEKLKKEVKSKFTSVDEISSGPALASCIYLRACIDEALRLCPPVPGLLPRENHNGGYVDGVFVPPGIEVGIPIWAIHRKPELYPEPETFRPERWIEDSPDQIERARSGMMPFSAGTRGCVGKSLAMMELQLITAKLAFVANIEPAGPLPNRYELTDFFGAARDGPFVKITLDMGEK
ncbi:cytochrome P450 monooxygenase [Fusarium oxysporum]|nr:cytochrome P450 monooxygenase [Fusarium oxysporum]